MKLLLLDNFFNDKSENELKKISKIIDWLYFSKLRGYLKKQIKKYNNKDIEIVILTNRQNFNININKIKIEKFSDFRIKIDRFDFLNLKKKVINGTKRNLESIFNNFNKIKDFHINGLEIAHLIEFQIASFLNRLFGEFEIIKKKILSDDFDKIIILDYNPRYNNFYRDLSLNCKGFSVFNSRILKFKNFISKLEILKYFIGILGFSIKSRFINKKNTIEIKRPSKKDNVLFIAETENQYRSLKPILEFSANKKEFNVIFYRDLDYLRFSQLNQVFKFFFTNKRIWKRNKDLLLKNIMYDSILLGKPLDLFYKEVMRFTLIKLHIKLFHFNQLLREFTPSLIVLADEMKPNSRAYVKKCNLKKIKTVFVPHSAIEVHNELISKPDFDYFTVPSKQAKDYFISKGIKSNKIYITGRPRYDYFYKEKISKLTKIKDMFDNRIYHFTPGKFIILLTTNPVDDKSNEIILTEIVKSLERLGLVQNLVVKLHPSENGIIHKKIFKKLNVEPIIVKDYDILKLIKSSDLMLSRTSTTTLEAMIIGTPMIILDFVNLGLYYTGSYLFSEDAKIINIKKVEDLYIHLEKVIKNHDFYKDYTQMISSLANFYFFYDSSRSSTSILYDLICNILVNK